MPEILLYTLLWTMAAFGAVMLVISALRSFFNRRRRANMKVMPVLIVKDQQEHIEGIVRSLFAADQLFGTLPGNELIILDMGSRDETLEILEKLKRDYEYIDVIREEEKERIFSVLQK